MPWNRARLPQGPTGATSKLGSAREVLTLVRVERLPFYGRMSTIMTAKRLLQNRSELLQGTLDMLILRTLLFGPAHGHQIAKHIQRTTEDFLQVEHGSLYPALHRMERKGWITAKWEMSKERRREFKYYRLTPAGREQLAFRESKWKRMAAAVARVMWPVPGDEP